MARFIDIVNGVLTQLVPIAASTGVTDASKIPQTDASGRLDASLMPASITGQVKILPASEALTAGQLVNIWDDSGTVKVRKADASLSRPAVGYVAAGFASGANATIYVEGINTQVTGLVPGAVWLGDAGAVTQTPPTSGSGGISQIVGTCLSATELEFEPNDSVYLASA
jgi:hypothetical protein